MSRFNSGMARVAWLFGAPSTSNVFNSSAYSNICPGIGARRFNHQTSVSKAEDSPTKETLLRIDWLVERLTPDILKGRVKPFFEICKDNVTFEDRIYNYRLNTRNQLLSHLAKVRIYYRYLSPYNKVERIGSCVYEGEDVIVLLWRLSTLESSFLSYFPSFITKKEPKINTVEGALDVHITKEGTVYKVVNRKITAADREGAHVLAKMKESAETDRAKQEEKQLRKDAENYVEDQKRQDRMLKVFPHTLRVGVSRSVLRNCRYFGDIDFSHDRPAPEQLEHIQTRLSFTVPLLFKRRMDYTFYTKDVICDDQIFRLQKQGVDSLMQHFGMIGFLGQFFYPHIEMEVVSIIPIIEDGTVRCRWRVKYVSFPRLFLNPKLFRRQYRLNNLSWFDGYSVLNVNGNGLVYKLTIQKTLPDESKLLNDKTTSQKLAEKIAVFRPREEGSVAFAKRSCDEDNDSLKKL